MTAYVDTAFARIKLHSERLIVLAPKKAPDPSEVLREVPLLGLEHLVLNEHVQITTEAVAALLRREVGISYLDFRGRILGQTLPGPSANGGFRCQQYQCALDPAFSLEVARRMIVAKIYNQRRLLQKADAYHDRCSDAELDRLTGLGTQAEQASSLDSLRGCEGAASALYFELWSRYLPPEFPFERRSAHPPLNAVNACISYGASLIYHELVATAHCRGLDPSLGHLHVTDNSRWSLALDLMEPFRPALVEALALRLFTLRMLSPEDFEPQNGGIYLKQAARKKFITEYERRMQRSFVSEHAGHRTSLRQQLREQVVIYKGALKQPENFRPFRLN